MTSATRDLLRVRAPLRRIPRRHDTGIVKGLARGLVAVFVVCAIAITVLAGAGWTLSTILKARSDIQTSVALSQPSIPSTNIGSIDGIPGLPRSMFASLSPPVSRNILVTRTAGATVAAKAVAMAAAPQESADPRYTGSLAPLAPKSVKPVIFSALLPPISVPSTAPITTSIVPEVRDESPAAPLPRARPRLASLQPANEIGIKPDNDSGMAKTSIYDITAQTVYLPNGDRLEAHSGLGSKMDDPRYIRERMRGATPPNTYKLTLRESLFHGVRALRMTPVDDATMFGRAGILAHTYMLGPNGQSNGCVSFKNYARFLEAFDRGEVNRMVVVSRLDKPPTSFAARRALIRSAAATP